MVEDVEDDYLVLNTLRNHLPSSFSTLPIQKKQYSSFRKLYYEDPLCNPHLANSNSELEHDIVELPSNTISYTWGKEKRFTANIVDLEIGPKNPIEYPHLFEKPITHFERHRQRIIFHKLAHKSTSHKTRHLTSSSPTDFDELVVQSSNYSGLSPGLIRWCSSFDLFNLLCREENSILHTKKTSPHKKVSSSDEDDPPSFSMIGNGYALSPLQHSPIKDIKDQSQPSSPLVKYGSPRILSPILSPIHPRPLVNINDDVDEDITQLGDFSLYIKKKRNNLNSKIKAQSCNNLSPSSHHDSPHTHHSTTSLSPIKIKISKRLQKIEKNKRNEDSLPMNSNNKIVFCLSEKNLFDSTSIPILALNPTSIDEICEKFS